MRSVDYDEVVKAVEGLCIAAAHELPDDVLNALEQAAQRESNPKARRVIETLIENAGIAESENIPLCQDTGLTVVFVEQGAGVVLKPPGDKPDATLYDAINDGVKAGYEKGYLRKSVVAEPLNERKNTGDNTPPVIHYIQVPGNKLKLTCMTKGAGCENKSQFKMFVPTADLNEVVDWIVNVVKSAGADACPPLIVGVGIGGNFESCCLLSKKALLRKLGTRNIDSFYAQLEEDLLQKINRLGLGPAGLGGDTTALDCMIEFAPCHIASLPVAVNIECHSHRHKTTIL
jgi:fumarate hydratase subunit alpha